MDTVHLWDACEWQQLLVSQGDHQGLCWGSESFRLCSYSTFDPIIESIVVLNQ